VSEPDSILGGAPDGYSLDELAERTGLAPRTIRFYRQSGLIDPPERRGRRAYYPAEAVERLRLIAELRDRGLGLDAIAKILENPAAEHQSLSDVLRLGDELRRPWIDDQSATMTRLELQETIGMVDDGGLAVLEHYGIATPMLDRPGLYLVPSVATLELSADLVAAGISPELARRCWEAMRHRLGELSRDLISLFVGPDAVFDGPEALDAIHDTFHEIRPIALRAVQLSFAHEIEQALSEFVASGGVLAMRPPDGAAGPDAPEPSADEPRADHPGAR
jgi:DNA-binding transcriptional MerR regulator